MRNQLAPNAAPAIILFTAVAAVVLRAAARRLKPQDVPGTEPAPATVTADRSQPRFAVTTGTHDGAGRDLTGPPALPGRPANVVEQAQPVFHELHAYGRNSLCAVCDSQYAEAGTPSEPRSLTGR